MHITRSADVGKRCARCGVGIFSIMTSELTFGVEARGFLAGSSPFASVGRLFSSVVFNANLNGMSPVGVKNTHELDH